MDELDRAIAGALRHGRRLGLLLLDLDRFKQVNDTLGHAAGDALLVDVAQRLRATVRRGDLAARLGGDEFAVILPEVPDSGIPAEVAARLVEVLRQPFRHEGWTFVCGCSIGVALCPDDAAEASELQRLGDLALYDAKGAGRDRYSFFRAEMNEAWRERQRIESELRQALDGNGIEVWYQPTIPLAAPGPCWLEALARWRHPTRGLVPPDVFIPVAEQSGMIHALGDHVLLQACAQAARWRRRNLAAGVAVNVSAVELRRERFAERALAALGEAGLPPASLMIEITETMLLSDFGLAGEAMRPLAAAGVRFALDDFGTGYSNLGYLRRLPLSTVKVDRMFVRDLPRDPDAAAIVRAIVSLARSLDLEVVAEGVETEEQARLVTAMSCHRGQGYLFAAPMPAAACARYLAANGGARSPCAGPQAETPGSSPRRLAAGCRLA
jgi:diguanylate cyclase (GGDEF)-like protein